MIRAASGVRHEPLDSCPIELCDHRRSQLVRNEHTWRIEVLQTVASSALFVAQIHAQASGDVVQIALTLVQVRIVNVVEDRGGFVERALHRPLRVDPLVADHGGSPSHENRIVEHQQLRVEDGCEIGATCRRDPPADLLELRPRSLPGPLEGGQLASYPIRAHRKTQHLRSLNSDERRANGDAG